MPDLTGRVLGRYELLRPIGHGGMAAVYQGRDRESGRLVAVKVLSPQVAENTLFLQRFRREARVVMKLQHPHIVPVEDFGEIGDTAYLVMPYLKVGSLADRLAQGPLTPAEGGRVMAQIAGALDYAHAQGVVHRDVKPSNILLDDDGNALLADFGLAQIHDASISLTGSALLGTPAYVSPEQVRGEAVDARSDQYSMGIVLYQLTTGQLPYEAETPMAVLMKQVNEPMPRPRQVNANIPEAVERVILKATAKNPGDRFESMAAFEAAFQAALAHALNPRAHPAPTIVLPPSISGQRPARRRLQPWWIAAAILLLAGCPTVWFIYSDTRPGRAEAGAIDPSAARLTAAAATIDALSTEIVAARAGAISGEAVGTAAAATASAAAPSLTPPAAVGTATPTTATLAPGTAAVTATAIPPAFSPTATQGVPSPTATSSSIPTATASRTPTGVVPTTAATLIPTLTLVPPTPTLPLPTATLPILACDTSDLTGGAVEGSSVGVGLQNGGDSPIRITGIFLDWPLLNAGLKEIRLGGDTIWSQGDPLPPTLVNSNWDDPVRAVAAGETEPLVFTFRDEALPTGYDLAVELNNECNLDRSA